MSGKHKREAVPWKSERAEQQSDSSGTESSKSGQTSLPSALKPRSKKLNLPLLEVLVTSAIIHLGGLIVLGGLTIYKMTRAPEAEFEAPKVNEQPVEQKVAVELTKPSVRPPKDVTMQKITNIEVPMVDIEVPKISAKVRFNQVRPKGLGFSGVGAAPNLNLNIDSFGTTRELEYAWEGTIYLFDHIKRLRTDGDWFEEVENKSRKSRKLYNYSFNIPSQDFSKGFPGISDQFEWFAIDFEAQIYWPEQLAGEYEFRLTSDDGSILQVDGRDVIDNDGFHSMKAKEGRVKLNEGTRKFRLTYFQGPKVRLGLILEYRRVGEPDWKLFDLKEFIRYQK